MFQSIKAKIFLAGALVLFGRCLPIDDQLSVVGQRGRPEAGPSRIPR